MKCDHIEGGVRISAQSYQVRYDKRQMLLKICSSSGKPFYGLSIFCAADVVKTTSPEVALDKDHSSGAPNLEFKEQRDAVLLEIEVASSLWRKRKLVFEFHETFFTAHLELQGKGNLDRVHFFRGCHNGLQFGSLPWFREYVCAQPNFIEKVTYHVSEYASIHAGIGTDGAYWGPCLNGAPFVFGFKNEDVPEMLFAGLIVPRGSNTFSALEYNFKDEEIRSTSDSIVGTQAFSLAYYGQEKVHEKWTSPRMIFFFERDRTAGFSWYVNHIYGKNLVGPCPVPEKVWSRPIYCGWHEQVAIGLEEGIVKGAYDKAYLESAKPSSEACTQANYERWFHVLEDNDIPVGTIIIDSRWQISNGLNIADPVKFPNLRGFIDYCHEKGKKVLLWLNAWDKGGLSDDFCLTDRGEAIAPDPTLPKYADLLGD